MYLFEECTKLCAICEVIGLCSDEQGRNSPFNGRQFFLFFDGSDLFYRRDRADGLEIEWKLDRSTILVIQQTGETYYKTDYVLFRDTNRGTEIRITCNDNDSTVEGCPEPFDPLTDCPRFGIRPASTFGYYSEDDCTHLAGIIRDGDITPCGPPCTADWTSPGNVPTLAFAVATFIDGYAISIVMFQADIRGSWQSEFFTVFAHSLHSVHTVAHHSVAGLCTLDCFTLCTLEPPVFTCTAECGGGPVVDLSVELVLT